MIVVLLLQSSLHVAGGSTSWPTGVSGANGEGDSNNGEGGGGGGGEGVAVEPSSWECISLEGHRIPHGENFVPGPDYCTVCKCEEGIARFCRAVLCQPPQECKSFRVGKTCCDFICLDDILPKVPDDNGPTTTDLGLRMVASAITAILSLALLLFLIHRLRQRRLRAHQQYYEDQLDSPAGGVGAAGDVCHNNGCCHNAAYCSANDHVDLFFEGHTPPYALWKPPSFYFNYEDNPPPYSEVVGSSSYQSSTLGTLTVQLPRESSADQAPIGIASQASAVAGMAQAASRLGTLERRETVLRSDQVYEDNDQCSDILPNEPAPPYSTLLPSNHSRGPPQSPARRIPTPQHTSATLDAHVPQSPACRTPMPQYVLYSVNTGASPTHHTHDTCTDNTQGSPTYNSHMIQSGNIQTTQTSSVHNKQDDKPHSLNDLNRSTGDDGCATRENNISPNEEIGAVGGMRSSSNRLCLCTVNDTCNVCYMNGATLKRPADSATVASSAPENINYEDHSDSLIASQITTVRQRVRSITEKQQQQQQHQMSTLEDFRVRLTQDLSDSSLSSTTQPTTQTLSTSSSDDTSIDTFGH